MIETALYLIPVQLSDGELNCVLPQANIALVSHIKHFIVENVRSARRFLKKCDREIDIDSLTFYELNRHTDPRQVSTYLDALEKGEPMGVISEAGCPAIADPGADVVAITQRKGLKVRPLVGPSSILMEQRIVKENQTQIFIETPYRNNSLLAEMVKSLPANLKLCIATDITGEREQIITRGVKEWGKHPIDLNKVPTIFLLYK